MKTMIISGGTDGLGKTIATHFKNKYQIIIFSPNKEKGERVAKELGIDYISGDVSTYLNCESLVKLVVDKYGSIDVAVNNAGMWIQGNIENNDPNSIRQVIEVNALGVVNLTRAVTPQMKLQTSGDIIIINSQAGLYAKAERTVYNLTKWGLTGFAKSLQPELAKDGIRVVSIHPGKMKTDMFKKLGIEKDMSDGLDTKHVATAIDFVLSLPPDTLVPEIGIKHLLG